MGTTAIFARLSAPSFKLFESFNYEAEIQQQGEILAAQMTSPEVMKIMRHLPDMRTMTLDVLAGEYSEQEWVDDSETSEEFEEFWGPGRVISPDGYGFDNPWQ